MREENKKHWKKPELIVISRSNPEESVLFACFQAAGPLGGTCGNERENSMAGSS
ncbi:MAG: hypothetical protein PF503_06550 [Desulfobacula sp.]|jgi:hypothetical protein|nr:hypothetical protein [Desulfobacula sp.]